MTMARDPASGDLVLLTVASLRRVAARAAPAQTWTWDGHDWSQRDPAVQPPYPAGLVADTRDGALVVLGRPTTGGGATDLALRVAATWTGTTWLRLGTGRTTSPGRSG